MPLPFSSWVLENDSPSTQSRSWKNAGVKPGFATLWIWQGLSLCAAPARQRLIALTYKAGNLYPDCHRRQRFFALRLSLQRNVRPLDVAGLRMETNGGSNHTRKLHRPTSGLCATSFLVTVEATPPRPATKAADRRTGSPRNQQLRSLLRVPDEHHVARYLPPTGAWRIPPGPA